MPSPNASEPPTDAPKPPPYAVVIRRARQARGLSRAEAAAQTDVVKASRWGQIENGYVMKAGTPVPTEAGDMQLAHMAHVVGASPEQLDEVGRGDAAEILREILRQDEQRTEGITVNMDDPRERALWAMALSRADRLDLIRLYRLGLEREREQGSREGRRPA